MFNAISEAITGIRYGGAQDPQAVSKSQNYGVRGEQQLKQRGAENLDHYAPHDVFTKSADQCEQERLMRQAANLYGRGQSNPMGAATYR